MNGKGILKKTRSKDHHERHEGCTKGTKESETGRKWVMTTTLVPKITLWRVIVAVIFAAGLYATYARFALGLSQSTHLTDPQPWGLWVGLGTLCGVGLSAGGFGIAAAVYLLGFERYRPGLRQGVLGSVLGYMSVTAGM